MQRGSRAGLGRKQRTVYVVSNLGFSSLAKTAQGRNRDCRNEEQEVPASTGQVWRGSVASRGPGLGGLSTAAPFWFVREEGCMTVVEAWYGAGSSGRRLAGWRKMLQR